MSFQNKKIEPIDDLFSLHTFVCYYKTKGMMAEIGKSTGIATLFRLKFKGFIAWWLWRTFYLAQVPTTKKKLKVIIDWSIDAIFKPDVAMIKRFKNESKHFQKQVKI